MTAFRMEWRKLVAVRWLWILIAFFAVCNIVQILEGREQSRMVIYSRNFEDPAAFLVAADTVYGTIRGPMTFTSVQTLVNRHRELESVNPTGPLVTGSVTGDRMLFNHYYSELEYAWHYEQDIRKVLMRAEDNTEYYAAYGNDDQVQWNRMVLERYADRHIATYYETEGFEFLLSYVFSSLLALLTILAALTPVFCREHETGMYPMLQTCRYGIRRVTRHKMAAAACFVVLVSLLYVLLDVAVFSALYTLEGWTRPLYSLPAFALTPVPIPIWTYVALSGALKTLALLCCGMLVLFSSAVFRESLWAFLSAFVVLSVAVNAQSVDAGMPGLVLNPIFLLANRTWFQSLSTVNVLGVPVEQWVVSLVSVLTLTGCCVLVIVWTRRRTHMCSARGVSERMRRRAARWN